MSKSLTYIIFVFFSLLFLNHNLCFGQEFFVSPDGLGNYWYIKGSKVVKLDKNSKILESYSNFMLGNPTSVDPMDPFRVLVFYLESQNLVLLNNNATPLGQPVSISELGIGEALLACRSARGGVWLYHRELAEVVHVDNQLKNIIQRFSLEPNYFEEIPNFMVESGGILYLGLANKEILRYDLYGARLETLKIQYSNSFRVIDDKLWVTKEGKTKVFNLNVPISDIEMYQCSCNSLPLIIKGKVNCFNGVKFLFCEKVVSN